MKKILNDPAKFVDESLEGIVAAHPCMLRALEEDSRAIVRKDAPVQGKVAIATGGGYGHLPVFMGYVGEGLADGCAVGNVFSSPSADTMLEVAKAIDGGKGVLFLYGNYFGDKMNFDYAAEMAAEDEHIRVESVRVCDDAASAPKEEKQKRRGVAGIFFAYKIAGACAASGADLDKVRAMAEKTIDNMATMGIGFTPCVIPASGQPSFEIPDDEIGVGIGIHGEPGISQEKMAPSKELVTRILDKLKEDLELEKGQEIALLFNGLGSTSLEELYLGYKDAKAYLDELGVRVYRPYVGEYATSLEMGGFSITILKLDEELKAYLDAPAKSPFFMQ